MYWQHEIFLRSLANKLYSILFLSRGFNLGANRAFCLILGIGKGYFERSVKNFLVVSVFFRINFSLVAPQDLKEVRESPL